MLWSFTFLRSSFILGRKVTATSSELKKYVSNDNQQYRYKISTISLSKRSANKYEKTFFKEKKVELGMPKKD